VNPLDFPLLTDENVHPDVVAFLRERGNDVRSVVECDLLGQSDVDLLRLAHESGRVILTHDHDFGTLAVARGEPFTGIVYLRPGHIRPEFTIETVEAIAAQSITVQSPFIVVAERRGQVVRIRVRQQ